MNYLLGGLTGGGLVFGLLLMMKKRELDQRAALLQQGFQNQGSGTQMLLELQGNQMPAQLQAYANQVAQQAAQDTLARVYGLTPSVVQSLSRLSSRLGL